jgi:D-cysteine desulfhydrase
MRMAKKLHLVHGPTPIQTHPALNRLLECEVWLKRDDMTAGAEAGNKIRKLEYLLGDALNQGADTVITCGGTQSNHARATALLCRQVGLRCALVLRSESDDDRALVGNLLLSHLTGAAIRFVTAAEYSQRVTLLQTIAEELRQGGAKPYVIPEGGSNGLGALGYVDAMEEVRKQIQLGLLPETLDSVAFACGSGGTAAGVALGLAQFGVAKRADAFAVCDDKSYFEQKVADIVGEATRRRPELGSPARLNIHDAFKGPRYGVMDAEQLEFVRLVAQETGLLFDPVYTGKALFGLSKLEDRPNRVLFIHTGGLPGLLAQASVLAPPMPEPAPTLHVVESVGVEEAATAVA